MRRSAKLIIHIRIYLSILFLITSVLVIAQQKAQQKVPDNIAPHPAPNQPIAYSHKQHLTLGLPCAHCHSNPDPGKLMSFPGTDTCMLCHSYIAQNKASIIKLKQYDQSGETIPWQRVYEIIEGVTWSHRVHNQAGIQCETCHGNVRESEAMAEETAIIAMATCISCHQAREVESKCEICHAWPADRNILSGSKP